MNRRDFEEEVKEIKEQFGYFVVYVCSIGKLFATDYKIINKPPYEELYLYSNGNLIAKTYLGDVIAVDVL